MWWLFDGGLLWCGGCLMVVCYGVEALVDS